MLRTNRLTPVVLAASVVITVSLDGRCSGDPRQPPPPRENRRAEIPRSEGPGGSQRTLDDLRWDPAISGKLKEIEELKQKIEQVRKLVVPKVFEKQSKPYREKIAALQKEVDEYVRSINEATSGQGDSAQLLTAERFAQLEKLIRPSPGESRWAEISWLLSVFDAGKKAAEEGKPIFLWSAGAARRLAAAEAPVARAVCPLGGRKR